MNFGIYGYEDLSNRYCRDQSNVQRPGLKMLSPIKKEVVEDEFYRFLRIKQYTIAQINTEMKRVNVYHRNSISAAEKKKRRLENENA